MAPQPAYIRAAAEALAKGRAVVFPTTGLYGLGANALDPRAVERIFDIKNRPAAMPILVLVSSRREASALVRGILPAAKRLMERFWPGPLTIVMEASSLAPPLLCAGTGKIGVRMDAHPVAMALVRANGGPVTGTSANLSGQPAPARVEELDQEVARRCAVVLDAGELSGGPGSTIVDVTVDPPAILRQGAVPQNQVLKALRA